MSEEEILNRVRKGDQLAFRELVSNYQRKVFLTCMGFLHNREDAEDITQDVFIEVYRSVNNFRGESKLSTWIYRIAVTRSLNFIRDNKKRKWYNQFEISSKEKSMEVNSKQSVNTDNPEFFIENSQRAALLYKIINGLPQNQKIAFTLSKYDDLSYQEIADIMNQSLSSVESLIHRAKLNLQKKLFDCYKKNCI